MFQNLKGKVFTKEAFKTVWFWVAVAFLLFTGIAYGSGQANATITLNNEKANLETVAATIDKQKAELQDELNDIEKQIIIKNKEFEGIESEIKSMQKVIDEANEILAKKDEILKENADLESSIKGHKFTLDELKSELEIKETELEKIENIVVSKGEEPIKLSPGQYTVGEDIPMGRYIAKPDGGNGNFVVYSDSGRLKVNTILGGSYGELSYTFSALYGYYLETDAPVILEAVE